jgi:hypothetical protein
MSLTTQMYHLEHTKIMQHQHLRNTFSPPLHPGPRPEIELKCLQLNCTNITASKPEKFFESRRSSGTAQWLYSELTESTRLPKDFPRLFLIFCEGDGVLNEAALVIVPHLPTLSCKLKLLQHLFSNAVNWMSCHVSGILSHVVCGIKHLGF